MNNLKAQMEFLHKIDELKDIFRQSLIINGKRRENDAEHSWHMAMVAIIMKEHFTEKNDLNLERALKMILIHDLVEIYAGDTPAFGAEREDKFQAELEGAKEIFNILPEKQSKEYLQLWIEFEEMNSTDSKYANVCDRFQGFMQNLTSDGHTWKKYTPTIDRVLERSKPIKDYAPEIFNKIVIPEVNKYMEKGYIIK